MRTRRVARPDHVRVESSSSCFPRELVSFVRPKELDCFYPWHVTRSCPIKRRRLSWEVPYGTEFLRALIFAISFADRDSQKKKKKKH